MTPERPTDDAFTELVRGYDRRLRALAYRLLGDRDRMDDVLQDAYVKAFRAMPTFTGRGGADVGTWLYRIVYNACLDDLRRERRHPTGELTDDDAAATASMEDSATRFADRTELADVFDELPEDQKTVVWLVDVEGFDYVAAGDVLGVAPGTIGSRLSRAHKQLRASLRRRESTEGGDG